MCKLKTRRPANDVSSYPREVTRHLAPFYLFYLPYVLSEGKQTPGSALRFEKHFDKLFEILAPGTKTQSTAKTSTSYDPGLPGVMIRNSKIAELDTSQGCLTPIVQCANRGHDAQNG